MVGGGDWGEGLGGGLEETFEVAYRDKLGKEG